MFTIAVSVELIILQFLLALKVTLSSVRGQCFEREVGLVCEGRDLDRGHSVHWEAEDCARVHVVGWRADQDLERKLVECEWE